MGYSDRFDYTDEDGDRLYAYDSQRADLPSMLFNSEDGTDGDSASVRLPRAQVVELRDLMNKFLEGTEPKAPTANGSIVKNALGDEAVLIDGAWIFTTGEHTLGHPNNWGAGFTVIRDAGA